MLATSPDDKVRDGKRAVELATKAAELSSHTVPHILSTLAAAYAEIGRLRNGQEVVEEGGRAGRERRRRKEQLAKELASYEEGKPCAREAGAGREEAGARGERSHVRSALGGTGAGADAGLLDDAGCPRYAIARRPRSYLISAIQFRKFASSCLKSLPKHSREVVHPLGGEVAAEVGARSGLLQVLGQFCADASRTGTASSPRPRRRRPPHRS